MVSERCVVTWNTCWRVSAVFTGRLSWRAAIAAIGQHQDDARRALRWTRIDGLDSSLPDRSFDDKPIGRLGPLFHLVGVTSASCDLEPSVDAIEPLADDAVRADIERV